MHNRRARLLRIGFLAGAITDAVALIGMLVPSVASLLWGISEESAAYLLGMRFGASLMLGWTLLLVWAYQRPVERSCVAPLTVVVICGFVVAEVLAVLGGCVEPTRLIPTWGSQLVLLLLFGAAYYYARVKR
jgi:hypothetical protein